MLQSRRRMMPSLSYIALSRATKAPSGVFKAKEGDCEPRSRDSKASCRDFETQSRDSKAKSGDRKTGKGPDVTMCPSNVIDRKSTRLNSSHSQISYAVFCLKKKKQETKAETR